MRVHESLCVVLCQPMATCLQAHGWIIPSVAVIIAVIAQSQANLCVCVRDRRREPRTKESFVTP